MSGEERAAAASGDAAVTEVAVGLVRAITRLRARLRIESAPAYPRSWSWSQLMTLARIVNEGPSTGSELAQAEHVRPQSMHETIAALRENGLVESGPHPEDGRKLLVSATPAGRELVERIPAEREAWLEVALQAHATPEELRTLREAVAVMERLADCELRPEAWSRPASDLPPGA